MTRHREQWTTQDLELYHDGELEPPRREELSAALRHDPALRSRLAEVYRVDEALRTTLTDQRVPDQQQLGRVPYRAPAMVIAASLLVAVTVLAWYSALRSPGHIGDVTEGGDLEPRHVAEALEYQPIRVVFSLPVRPTREQRSGQRAFKASPRVPLDTAADDDAHGFLAKLDDALRTGQIESTLKLLEGTSRDDRSAAYRYIGELLRSALVAEQILDRLSPREQLAVCSEWAREPGLRPVVFARLRRFSEEPALSDAVQVLVSRFASEPTLWTWLRGYQLVDGNTAEELTPS